MQHASLPSQTNHRGLNQNDALTAKLVNNSSSNNKCDHSDYNKWSNNIKRIQ